MRTSPKTPRPFRLGLSILILLLATATSWGTKIGDYDFEQVVVDHSPVFLIQNVTDLKALVSVTNNGDLGRQTFKLTADLDLSNQTFTSIGNTSSKPFNGTFDGDNHTITGLKLNCYDDVSVNQFCGLFGYNTGTIKKVHLKNVTINELANNVLSTTKHLYMGGIAGHNFGTISNCKVETISITNSIEGNVSSSASSFAGGIAGENSGTIDSCQVTGAKILGNILHNRGAITGGFAATGSPKVTNCEVRSSTVTGNSSVGGIIGNFGNSSGTIGNNIVIGTTVSGSTNYGQIYGSICTNCSASNNYYYNSSSSNIFRLKLTNSSSNVCKTAISASSGFTFDNEGYYQNGTNVSIKFTTDNGYYCKFALASSTPAVYTSGNKAIIKMTRDTVATVSDSLRNYNIEYNLNGHGTIPQNTPLTYTVKDEITLPTPTEDGYIFYGWSSSSEYVTSIPKGSTGNKSFEAFWQKDIATYPGISFSEIPDQIFTGSQIKPAVTVMDGTTDITNKFSLSYTNNTKVGKASIYIVAYNKTGEYGGSITLNFNIIKKTPTVTAPKARDLEYNTRSQNLVIAGSTSNGKMLYSLDGESYSQSVPTAINAGTYTVYYKVEETDNYSGVSGSVETTIKKIAPTVSAPTPIENLEFNGSPQELVVAGEANSGPMLYRLCKSLSGSNCSEFSEEIPTATNAQQYLINVWVKATDNYEASHGTYSVTIAKAKAKITTEAEAKNLTYSGKSQELVTAASTNNSICSVVYSTDETNYSEKISTAVNAGTYTVWYKLNPNCYSDEEIRQIEVTIGKAKPTVTMATGIKGLVYNGKAQKLVVAGSANSGPTLYSLDGKNFSEEIPTATDAGAYYIYQQVKETKNYAEFTAKVEPFPIEIKPLEVTPYTLTGRILEYNGKAQELVTPGPAGVCLLYYLGENPTSLDDFSRKIPTAVEIGQYVIFYELDRKNCVSDKFNGDFRSTIEKGIAPEPQGITLTYNGEPQELTDAEPNACISYSLDKEHFSTEIPKAVNADQYYVTYKVDLEHCVSKNSREYGDFKSLIERATVTEPRAKLLAYNGNEQELIIPGEPSACLGYSLGKEYSTQIPTGKEPKDYKINYKVIDSKNCYETSGNVTAIIDKNMKLTPPQAIAKVLNFTGEKQKLIIPGSSEYGTMLYSLDGINYEKDVPVAIDPGFYTIHFKVDYSENFYISEGTVSTIIAEKPANFAFVDVFMMNKKTYATLDGDYIEKEAFKPEEISIDTVIFNRKFPITNGNNYSTLMLPFDAELDQLEGVSESNVFEFVGVRRNETTKALQVEIASVSRIKAYTPYIVQMNKQTLQINGPVVLRKLTDKPITTVEDWTLIGTIDYTEWNKESKDLGRIYGFSAYPFDSKAGKHYDAGQFIKFSPGSFIKPMRAYLFYGGKVTNNAPVPKGEESSIASIDEELPDRMDVVIVDRRGEEEHTTVIGSFSPRTGEFRINRNYGNRTFDLKGRNIGKPRAKGIYLKK